MCPIAALSIFFQAGAYSHSQHKGEVGGVLDVSTAVMETACLLQNVI